MSEPRLELHTVARRDDGCFSVLLWDGRPFAVSVEHTYGEWPKLLSGEFWCLRDVYHKGGYETFEIQLPGHDRVLFHKGNTEGDSAGCVVVGESFGVLKEVTAVQDSKGGFEEFMLLAKGLNSFKMKVTGR